MCIRDRVTDRASVSTSAVQADMDSLTSSVSADGRYVAFVSAATNLVPGDTNGPFDVFVRDRQLGVTERVSVSSSGTEGDDFGSFGGTITPGGRFVVFGTYST